MEVFDLLLGVSFKVIHGKLTNIDIKDVVFDSRNNCEDAAFVCIKGKNYDSHNDFNLICDKGAKLIVVDRDITTDRDVLVIKVENTRKALSYLCINLFEKPHKNLRIIGITGTKGKTSTALMLKRMLDETESNCGIIGSLGVYYNNIHIETINATPDPYTMQKILRDMVNTGVDTVVMEVSAIALKQDRVSGIEFDISVLTNIMTEYMDYCEFKDSFDYLESKIRLFDRTKVAIINGDNDYTDSIKKATISEVHTFGLTADVDFRADNVNLINNGKDFGLSYDIYDIKRTHVNIYQIGRQNVYNSLAAIYVMSVLGYNLSKYVPLIKDIQIKGRAEAVKNNMNKKIFIDCAVRPAGFSSIFEAISEYKENKLISIFSVDNRSNQDERMELVKIACTYSDICLLVTDENNAIGKEVRNYIDKSDIACKVFTKRSDAIRYAIKESNEIDIILLLGTGFYDKSIFNSDYDIVKNILNS